MADATTDLVESLKNDFVYSVDEILAQWCLPSCETAREGGLHQLLCVLEVFSFNPRGELFRTEFGSEVMEALAGEPLPVVSVEAIDAAHSRTTQRLSGRA